MSVRVALVLALCHAVVGIRLSNGTVAAHHNASDKTHGKTELTEDEQLHNLQVGLASIHNLKATFTSELAGESAAGGASKFAEGALSMELGKKDSAVWSAIEGMLTATAKVQEQTQGKSKDEKEKLMKSLEEDLDTKATMLRDVTDKTTEVQQHLDAEYVLGLLNQHREWSMERQLNATRAFAKNSKIVQQLLAHYDATKPLAPQLAEIMDASEKKVVEATHADKAAIVSKKALHMFIQLANDFQSKPRGSLILLQQGDAGLERDCPFCVAQCVGKCHDGGKAYTSCLTECADAGK